MVEDTKVYEKTEAFTLRDLALERRVFNGNSQGFAVYVRGAILRSQPYERERWFTTEEAAIRAGQRARK